MVFERFFSRFIQALFPCNHRKARIAEGKTYCPDCGQGILGRWIALHCIECGQRRPTRYLFRQVVPAESCCTHCGERKFRSRYLQDPEFFQLRHALLSFEAEPNESAFLYQARVFVLDALKQPVGALKSRYWEASPSPRYLPPSLSF